MISHPLGYIRDSTEAKMGISVATFSAVFITLPVTVAQFFFLFPSNIKTVYNSAQHVALIENNRYYYYDDYIKVCYRYFFPDTIDYKLIVYFINTVNALAAFLIALSFSIIAFVIVESRSLKNDSDNLKSPSFHKKRIAREKKRKRQNFKIARMSIFSTSCVILPWLPSLVISTVLESVGYDSIVGSLGIDWATNLFRWNQFLYYLVTWLFPLMVIVTNPSVARANRLVLFGSLPASYQLPSISMPSRTCKPPVPRPLTVTTAARKVSVSASLKC